MLELVQPADQQRDRGEPSLIAGITRQIMARRRGRSARVYVAGLSAGGAAAAVWAPPIPISMPPSAFIPGWPAGRPVTSHPLSLRCSKAGKTVVTRTAQTATVPTIVFHGDGDTTVNPINGDQVIAQATAANLRLSVSGAGPGGMPMREQPCRSERLVRAGAMGVHGAGHAWSGGSPAGSYTDPRGPSPREMLRFFLAHAIAAA